MNNKKKLSVLAIAAVATSLFTLAPVASYAADTDAAAAPQVKCLKDGATSMVASEKDCTDMNGTVAPADQSSSTTTTNTTNTTTSTSTVGTDAKSMPNEPASTMQQNNGAMGNQPADSTQQQSAPAGSQ